MMRSGSGSMKMSKWESRYELLKKSRSVSFVYKRFLCLYLNGRGNRLFVIISFRAFFFFFFFHGFIKDGFGMAFAWNCVDYPSSLV